MRFPAVINDVRVDMYCASATESARWRDITADVLNEGQVTISHGRADELSNAEPARCSFVLKDLDGDYSPRNALSQYHGYLTRNTPVRVRTGMDKDEFGTTVVNGWGTSTSGRAWTHVVTGSIPAPTNADFDKGSGVGTVNVPSQTDIRIAYLADSIHADADCEITFSLPAAAITGGPVLPAGLIFRGVSLTDFLYARISIGTDGAFSLSIVDDTNTIVAPLVVVPGLAYAQNVQYTVRALAAGRGVYARVWRTDQGEPITWHTSATMPSTPKYRGWVGIRTALGTLNSNGPLLVTYSNYQVRSARFQGEISSYKPVRDITGNASFVAVSAGGSLRRLSQGQDPVQSALRRSVPGESSVVAYWPCEDGKQATRFESATGGAPLQVVSSVLPDFASNSEFDASAPLPVIGDAIVEGALPAYNATLTNKTQFRFLLRIPDSGSTTNAVIARLWGSGSARLWQILYDSAGSGTLFLEAYNIAVVNLPLAGASLGAAVNGKLLLVSLELSQNGANVDWALRVYEQNATGIASVTGTLNSRTIKQATSVDFNPIIAAISAGDIVIGHVFVQSTITPLVNLWPKVNAWNTETAGARIARLSGENGVVDTRVGDNATTARMGPQRIDELLDLLRECSATDMGSLYDSRAVATADGPSIEYRTLGSAYDQDPVLTLDLSAGQVAPPWEPVDDDQQIRNDVTASRVNGSESRATLETGPLSVLPAVDGGIGRYRTSYTVNTATDAQLSDVAGWQLALGTVNEYRHPTLAVDLANPDLVAAGLADAVLDVWIDDRVTVVNAESSRIYDDIDQVTRGYRETVSSTMHRIEFNGTPYAPYAITVLNDGLTFLDAESSTLYEAVDSTATVLRVVSETESWTSTVPYDIVVGGERMTVTAVANPAYRTVGTEAHADNASVVPGLPTGHAAKDLLLLLAAIRNSGTGTVNTPAGYTLLVDGSNVRLFGKVDSGAESAPTVSFTGGVAGATCSAQMVAFQRVALAAPVGSAVALNGAAQNMAILQSVTRSGPKQVVVSFGWKQDDWTSVAVLTGATEIAEFFSVLGSDQGCVWDYQLCDGLTTAPWGESFTVTGGTSQISRTGAVTLRGYQELTVTRSINGVVKAHPVDAEVHVFQPARLAL